MLLGLCCFGLGFGFSWLLVLILVWFVRLIFFRLTFVRFGGVVDLGLLGFWFVWLLLGCFGLLGALCCVCDLVWLFC